MTERPPFNCVPIVLAVIAAEALPIFVLIVIVFGYSLTKQTASLSPEEFAPMAGNWVGPIGGFLATWLFAWWAARRASRHPLACGVAIGVGTALLDASIAALLAGGGAVSLLLLLSNGGRIIAGVLGGWLAARRGDSISHVPRVT